MRDNLKHSAPLEKNKMPEDTNQIASLGTIGENLAAKYLVNQGYRLIMRNFTAPIGRNKNGALIHGEIDLIALDGETLCFIEVKSRSKDDLADPIANVDLRKKRAITRTSKVYRRIFGLESTKVRFDAISIVFHQDKPQITLFKDFWLEKKFRAKVRI